MHDYKITDQAGRETVVRALSRATAVRLYCEATGRTKGYVRANCVVRKI